MGARNLEDTMLTTLRKGRGTGFALTIALMVFTGALAACSAGNTGSHASAATNATSATTATPSPAQSANQPPSRQYKVDSGLVSLTNSLNNEKIEITVTKVVDPAVSRPGAGTPDPGDRFVAVQYEIHNVGKLPYDGDTAQMAAILVDRRGQQFKPVFVQPKTSAGPNLPDSFNVVPGQQLLGNVIFELPDASLPGQAQWNMGMGFGGTAMWNISGS